MGRVLALVPILIALIGCSDESSATLLSADSGASDVGRPDTAQQDVDRRDAGEDVGPPPDGDTCGDPVDTNAVGTVDVNGDLVVLGTNRGARSDYSTCDPMAPSTRIADVVYRYTPETSGRLSWNLADTTPTLFTVDVRTTCADEASMVHCAQCYNDCHAELDVVAGEPMYLVISGIRTTGTPSGMGDFELSFNLQPWLLAGDPCDPAATEDLCAPGMSCQDDGGPICGTTVCGDGILGYELFECDDANAESGDGCSASCQIEEQGPGGASCTGATELNLAPTRVSADEVFRYGMGGGDFVGGSDLGASCAWAAGPEALFLFELTEVSKVEVSADGADVLTVRKADAAGCAGEEVACTNEVTPSLGVVLDSVEPGRYLLILDREEPSAFTAPGYLVEVGAWGL